MGKIMDFLKNAKLRDKMLLSYLAACLIPLLITTVFIFRFSVKNMEEESMELAHLYSSQIVTNIDRFMDEYGRITKAFLVDNDMLADISRMEAPSIYEEVENRLQVRRLLMRVSLMSPDVENIMFLAGNGSFYQYNSKGELVNQRRLQEEAWLQELTQAQKQGRAKSVLMVTPAHFKNYYETEHEDIAVTVGRRIFDHTSREVGLLLIDVNPEKLVEMNETFQITRNNYHIRIRAARKSDGAVLYDSDVISGYRSWQEVIREPEEAAPDEKEYLVLRESTQSGEIMVEAVIPRAHLMAKASRVTMVSLIAIGISVWMIIGLSVVLSRTILRPITELQRKIERMGDGEYARVEAEVTSDEIGTLIQHYNHMVEKIQTLINDVYVAEIRQKDAKIMALRTQINPHMLYNTLESIRMKALVKGDAEAAEMIKILAKMFRASLGKDDSKNTVRTELEYVENYVKLQNVRFQGIFEYTYEAEEALLDVPVMPLVFQPIVENCIEHGYRGHHEKLKIQLKLTKLKEDTISVIFKDNGKGMPEDRLKTLRGQLEFSGSNKMRVPETADDGSGSIGLKNIAERIYLRFGKEYFVKILESGDEGTVIEMRLPM